MLEANAFSRRDSLTILQPVLLVSCCLEVVTQFRGADLASVDDDDEALPPSTCHETNINLATIDGPRRYHG